MLLICWSCSIYRRRESSTCCFLSSSNANRFSSLSYYFLSNSSLTLYISYSFDSFACLIFSSCIITFACDISPNSLFLSSSSFIKLIILIQFQSVMSAILNYLLTLILFSSLFSISLLRNSTSICFLFYYSSAYC